VIRSDQDKKWSREPRGDRPSQSPGRYIHRPPRRLVILVAVPPVGMSGVIYIIEVDKHERRAVLLPVPNSRLRRWGGAWFVSHDVRSLRLQQIGKARPIVEHGDAARGVLGRSTPKIVGTYRPRHGRLVETRPCGETSRWRGSRAVRARPVYRRRPVRAAQRRDHAPRLERPRGARDEAPQFRYPRG